MTHRESPLMNALKINDVSRGCSSCLTILTVFTHGNRSALPSGFLLLEWMHAIMLMYLGGSLVHAIIPAAEIAVESVWGQRSSAAVLKFNLA